MTWLGNGRVKALQHGYIPLKDELRAVWALWVIVLAVDSRIVHQDAMCTMYRRLGRYGGTSSSLFTVLQLSLERQTVKTEVAGLISTLVGTSSRYESYKYPPASW